VRRIAAVKCERNVSAATFSADGKLLAFAADHSCGSHRVDIFVGHANGSQRRVIARVPPVAQLGPAQTQAGDYQLAFSPDGRWLAYSRSYGARIVLVDSLTGKRRRTIRTAPGGFSGPFWAFDPDRRQIVYSSQGPPQPFGIGKVVITIADPLTGKPKRSLPVPQGMNTAPQLSWGHGGNIAMATGNGPVYTVRSDGSHERALTHPTTSAFDSAPKWSPDGSSILFARDNQYTICGSGCGPFDGYDLYVISGSGGRARRLTHTTSETEWSGVWSPDSRGIAYALGKVYVVPARGGKPRKFAAGGPNGFNYVADWQALPGPTS
jgi:Tol biopolymer transport system component